MPVAITAHTTQPSRVGESVAKEAAARARGASQHAAARYHTRKGTAAVVAAVTDAAQVGHGGRLCRGRAVGWAILPPLPQRGACRKRAEAASTMLLAAISTNVAL